MTFIESGRVGVGLRERVGLVVPGISGLYSTDDGSGFVGHSMVSGQIVCFSSKREVVLLCRYLLALYTTGFAVVATAVVVEGGRQNTVETERENLIGEVFAYSIFPKSVHTAAPYRSTVAELSLSGT